MKGPIAGVSLGGVAVPRRASRRGLRSRGGIVQVGSGQRLGAVAAACVQVGGEVGQHVQPGHFGRGRDSPDAGGDASRVAIAGGVGVLPGHDGQRSARSVALSRLIVGYSRWAARPSHSGPASRAPSSPPLASRGGHLLPAGLIDRGQRSIPCGPGCLQPGGRTGGFRRCGCGVPGSHELVVRRVQALIRSSHAWVQYVSWEGLASAARTK